MNKLNFHLYIFPHTSLTFIYQVDNIFFKVSFKNFLNAIDINHCDQLGKPRIYGISEWTTSVPTNETVLALAAVDIGD